MEKLFWIGRLTLMICSCVNEADHQDSNKETEGSKAAKSISSRDRSINPLNSYSDLFLDSLTMEKFISQKALPDTIANRMRSFYNARNYQFAWFNSEGLTEEARGFWNLHDYVTTYDKDTSLKDKSLQRQ